MNRFPIKDSILRHLRHARSSWARTALVVAWLMAGASIQAAWGAQSALTGSKPNLDDHVLLDDPARNGVPSKDNPPLITDNGGGGTCALSQSDLEVEDLSDDALANDTGDPVSLHNGMVSVRRTDLFIPGRGIHFELTRRYNSKRAAADCNETPGPLGKGWDHSYAVRLQGPTTGPSNQDTATVWNGNNRAEQYIYSTTTGQWEAPKGIYATLRETSASGVITGWVLRGRHGGKTYFSATGRLEAMEDTSGNQLAFAYNATSGLLETVYDSYGRAISFTYANGRLIQVQDYLGRKVVYSYDSSNRLSSVRSPLVTSTGDFNNFPSGRTEVYEYDECLLEKIHSPQDVAEQRGASVEFDYETWGSSGPWCTKQRLGSDWIHYYYDSVNVSSGEAVKCRVVDRNANETTYTFSPGGHALKIDEVVAAASTGHLYRYITYNDHGEVLEVLRRDGTKEVRVYDSSASYRSARGNLLERKILAATGSPPAEIVETFAWEPVFQHICFTTDPLGNRTDFLCDYMEGSCDSQDSNYNLDQIASEMGISLTEAGTLLGCGSTSLLKNADLNGDGQIDARVDGKNIARLYPRVTLSNLGGVSGQAGHEQGASQPQSAVQTYSYNQYGQRTADTDPEENVTVYLYYPEGDPDGDGQDIISGLDTTTGGYLKQVVQDTALLATLVPGLSTRALATDFGRNSGLDPAETERKTDYMYDRAGNITAVIDPRGVKTQYFVNELNEVWKTLYAADVSAVSSRHGGCDPQTAESLTALQYDAQTAYDHNGNVIGQFIVNTGGLPDSEDGGDAKHCWERTFAYDARDRKIEARIEIGPSGEDEFAIWSLSYDGNDNLEYATDSGGNTTKYTYDERDLVLSIKAAYGTGTGSELTKTIVYGPHGRPEFEAIATNSTVFLYDGFSRLQAVVDAVGSETVYTYDNASNVRSITAKGKTGGASPTGSSPLANTSGNVSLRLQEFTYDERHRLVRVDVSAPTGTALIDGDLSASDGKVTARYDYDRLGRQTFIVEDDKATTETRYDGAGRAILTTDTVGNQTAVCYDDNGNAVKVTAVEVYPSGFTLSSKSYETYSYFDALDRAISVTDNIGQTQRYVYDSRGNVITSTDANGSMTPAITINGRNANQPGSERRYWYDGLNRPWREEYDVTGNTWNPDDKIRISRSWNAAQLLKSQTDDNGKATSWTYNARRQPVRQTFADNTYEEYRYDSNLGWLDRVTDARGNTKDLSRDLAGRLTGVSVGLGSGSSTYDGSTTQSFEYDGLNRQTEAVDLLNSTLGSWTVEREYDALSRVVTDKQGGQTVSNAWREEGKRTQLKYPGSGPAVTYSHDALDRVATITAGGVALASYEYAGTGRLLTRSLNLTSTKRLHERHHNNAGDDSAYYDGVGRPIRQDNVNRFGIVQSGFEHGFSRTNQRTYERRTHTSPVVGDRYTNDEVYRLTTFDRDLASTNLDQPGTGTPGSWKSWSLDGVHNWGQTSTGAGSVPNTVNSVNEYTAFGSNTPGYDADGNMTSPHTGAGGTVVLKYDAFNRLRRVEDGSSYVEHHYDANGRRVRTITSGVTGAPSAVTYYYDGWDVIEEHDGSNAVMRRFVLGSMDEPLRLENLSFHPGTGTYFYHRSTLGHVVALTDTNGDVVERYTYDAYGTPQFEDASSAVKSVTRSDYGNPYLFTARRYEPWILGLYEFRHRVYFPERGRFLQRDPIGTYGSIVELGNPYSYAGSRPLDMVDPYGEQAQAALWTAAVLDPEPVTKVILITAAVVVTVATVVAVADAVPSSPMAHDRKRQSTGRASRERHQEGLARQARDLQRKLDRLKRNKASEGAIKKAQDKLAKVKNSLQLIGVSTYCGRDGELIFVVWPEVEQHGNKI